MVRRSLTNRLATLAFSFTSSLIDCRGLTRLVSKSEAQAFSRPATLSASMIPAAVPLVIPHFLNPVATKTRSEPGDTGPTNGTWSTGA